jgi:hypothetical protein
MNSPEIGPKFKNIKPEEISDTSVYTGSLSMINLERNEILEKLNSLDTKGVSKDDLEVTGLKFRLKELSEQEKEIRESMKK